MMKTLQEGMKCNRQAEQFSQQPVRGGTGLGLPRRTKGTNHNKKRKREFPPSFPPSLSPWLWLLPILSSLTEAAASEAADIRLITYSSRSPCCWQYSWSYLIYCVAIGASKAHKLYLLEPYVQLVNMALSRLRKWPLGSKCEVKCPSMSLKEKWG